MKAIDDPGDDRYAPAKEVWAFLGLSERGFYNLLNADPSFPRPVRLSRKAVRWHMAKVRAYAESKTTEPADV